jgi:hypothetical protein
VTSTRRLMAAGPVLPEGSPLPSGACPAQAKRHICPYEQAPPIGLDSDPSIVRIASEATMRIYGDVELRESIAPRKQAVKSWTFFFQPSSSGPLSLVT